MTDLLTIFLNGILAGGGSAVGAYVATRYALKRVQEVEEKLFTKLKRLKR